MDQVRALLSRPSFEKGEDVLKGGLSETRRMREGNRYAESSRNQSVTSCRASFSCSCSSKKGTRIAYTFNHMHPSGDPNEKGLSSRSILCLICKHAACGAVMRCITMYSLPPPKKGTLVPFTRHLRRRRNSLTHDHIAGSSCAYIFMLLNNEWKGTQKSLSSSPAFMPDVTMFFCL